MTLVVISLLLATASAAWRTWRRLRFFLHRIQLDGYHLNEYTGRLQKERRGLLFSRTHAAGVVILLAHVLATGLVRGAWVSGIAGLLWTLGMAEPSPLAKSRAKKPLKFTARLRRLLLASTIPTAVAVVAGGILLATLPLRWAVLGYLAAWLVAETGTPLWVIIGSKLMRPLEARIQEGFKDQARRRLSERQDLTVVGITGSYGKTSVKFILEAVLRRHFSVLVSPSSYNTPMGICIVVNDQLQSHHQILILEMGARYVGDIRELCAIARPDIAVVTSVGKAHLETMGPIDRIARVKAELVENMKDGGTVVLNADDPRVNAMSECARGPVWRVSANGNEAEVKSRDIVFGPQGSSFLVVDDEGEEQRFQTRLLGRHNVQNILFALAVGRSLGLRLRQMAHAVKLLEPVEHRLQLRSSGEITVIDDAFNANPVGARNAIEILGSFRGGKRIVVTPGMVELGGEQDEENRKLGAFMAEHIDLALLIGPQQTRPIFEGLRGAGFPEDRIHVFHTLFEAQDRLSTLASPGDIVLYENDLPDQYTESAA